MPEAERWVSVQILYGHEMLSISIINPSRPVQITGGQIASTKPDLLLHGFWLAATWRISWKSTTLNTPSRSRMPDLFLLLTGQIQIT